jgi:hypothetical protein
MNPDYKPTGNGYTMKQWLAYRKRQQIEWLNKIRKSY